MIRQFLGVIPQYKIVRQIGGNGCIQIKKVLADTNSILVTQRVKKGASVCFKMFAFLTFIFNYFRRCDGVLFAYGTQCPAVEMNISLSRWRMWTRSSQHSRVSAGYGENVAGVGRIW